MEGWMVEAWKYRYASEEESHTPYVAVNRCGFCVFCTSTVTLMQVDGPNVTVDAMINLYRTTPARIPSCYLTAVLTGPQIDCGRGTLMMCLPSVPRRLLVLFRKIYQARNMHCMFDCYHYYIFYGFYN